MTSETKIHWLNLRALLESTRQECESYDKDPLLIQVRIGGKVFMELSRATLFSADLFTSIDQAAFEEAIKSDSSLRIDVSRPVAGENLCH
jgi:hypothetical protein